uniref:Putative secreted protein n=1 Tax=Anopheles darlingi TaxID=43151 RepID=A0A2M4DQZ4_ANODA
MNTGAALFVALATIAIAIVVVVVLGRHWTTDHRLRGTLGETTTTTVRWQVRSARTAIDPERGRVDGR